jgi:hypothetical protein
MNLKMLVLTIIAFVGVMSFGCRNRTFVNVGKDPTSGIEIAVTASSIGDYAKEHSVSREEAVKHFRQEIDKQETDK